MNSLTAHIEDISSNDQLVLLGLKHGDSRLTAILLATPAALLLRKGEEVKVEFKETEVFISTDENPRISIQNRLKGKVVDVVSDGLLSQVCIDIGSAQIKSVITANAVKQLGLKPGDQAIAMIKTNELMINR